MYNIPILFIIFKRKEMADIELPQEVTQWELNQF